MGKEFEKWINYNWDTLSNISPYPYSNLLSEGWKAALEWIYLQCCPEAWDVGDIEDDIEEELKDG